MSHLIFWHSNKHGIAWLNLTRRILRSAEQMFNAACNAKHTLDLLFEGVNVGKLSRLNYVVLIEIKDAANKKLKLHIFRKQNINGSYLQLK